MEGIQGGGGGGDNAAAASGYRLHFDPLDTLNGADI